MHRQSSRQLGNTVPTASYFIILSTKSLGRYNFLPALPTTNLDQLGHRFSRHKLCWSRQVLTVNLTRPVRRAILIQSSIERSQDWQDYTLMSWRQHRTRRYPQEDNHATDATARSFVAHELTKARRAHAIGASVKGRSVCIAQACPKAALACTVWLRHRLRLQILHQCVLCL